MLKFEVLDLGLVIYKNAIPNPEEIINNINRLDDKISRLPHLRSVASNGWFPWDYNDTVFCMKRYIPYPDMIPDDDIYKNDLLRISEDIFEPLNKCFEHYSNEIYPFAGRVIKIREKNPHMLRYVQSGFLPAHQDQGISSRVLTSTIYFNDNYEGGEIEFRHSNIKIKPGAGDIIFFPSNYLYIHEVYPMHSGTRYVLPAWWHSMNPPIDSDGSE